MTAPPISVLSNYYGNLFLQRYLVASGCWIGLHQDDPTVTGDGTTELAGGLYIRQHALFTPATSKTVATSNSQTFVGLLASTVRYIAFWDLQAAGHMIAVIALLDSLGAPAPIVVPESGHFLAAAGDLALSL